jgi:hypothetical protein
MPEPQIFSDHALARRLELAEATAGTRYVESRARILPEVGAEWIEVAGAYAMYDGPHSPLTQTFGLGLHQPINAAELDTLEAFFRNRGAPIFHEVSPLADLATMPLLSTRGYRPVEFTSVMFLPLRGRTSSAPPTVHARLVSDDESALWAQTAAEGWSEYVELGEFMRGFAEVAAGAADVVRFVAELDGQAIAAGALCIHKGVALLAGAATIPQARQQGAQRALLEARLRHASESGCDLAMMCAAPGSASQRNAERQGFRIAYTRIKWGLAMNS